MDPGYHEVLAEPERAVGRVVDWTVKIVSVEKAFYTYTLKALFVPDHGEEACGKCPLTITFRGRPEENARPSRFKAKQVIRIRGTVLKLTPQPSVLAFIAKED
jgi:hypothetical protein